ncbi:Poly(U)-binding-splicing factor puf60 [Thoreauomyces humboldtii]|nr:Poly(U)-binding-splicing factor puf60 [Thoreauomyces humboldtii]
MIPSSLQYVGQVSSRQLFLPMFVETPAQLSTPPLALSATHASLIQHAHDQPYPLPTFHRYIEFEETVSADAAIAAMNNFELGGVPLRVRKAIIGGPMPPGMKNIDSIRPLLTPGFPQTAPKIPMQVLTAAQNINNAIAQRTGFPVQSQASALSTNAALQSALAKVQASVNDEHVSLEENMSISASQRYEIMQKLMRNEVVPQQMISSRVICLRNMVSVKDVDDTLNDEISEECGKYGVVTKVLMWARPLASQPSDPVDIYVRFGDVSAAGKARQALDQRWFAGRQVAAAFCPEKEFADKEAESKA